MKRDKQAIVSWLQARVAALLGDEPDSIAVDRPFMDYGLASAEGVAMIAALSEWLQSSLSPALLWDCPDIEALANHVCGGPELEPEPELAPNGDSRIAIVGMACRYPGAPDLAAYWELLDQGRVAVGPVPPERWNCDAIYHEDPDAPGRSVGREGGFLSGLDHFDAHFFGISPREAPHVDPRQRLTLELAWEAFEHAGVRVDDPNSRLTGVFVSVLSDDYNVIFSRDISLFRAATGPGTANSIVANRVSFALDLRGPSISIDTACSGSLVALTMACRSLRSGECTLALAGGVNVNLIPNGDVLFTKMGALSPTGRCRTFDVSADGIVRAEGAGMLLLKPMAAALADGDHIHAVICGESLNHDGRTNGIMAPSGAAQEALVTRACRSAGIREADVQWVEAHGTGTPLGDPIEVNALTTSLGRGRRPDQPLVLGAVKANIGHTEAAAGIAGVIKVALALRHGRIPPQPGFERLNPRIDQPEFPLVVPEEPTPWPSPGPRIAGVSGFGFGGSNAHVLIGEAPVAAPEPASSRPPFLLPVSGRSPAALVAAARSLAGVLEDAPLADICHTAARHRAHHKHRRALVVRDPATAREALEQVEAGTATGRPPRIAFVFGGQGTHWPGMAADLLDDPTFLAPLAPALDLFELHGTPPLLPALHSDKALERTDLAQPAIFLVQLGLAHMWLRAGIEPVAILGQSLGEVAAAHIAGALSLEDAVSVVFHRSRLMQEVAGGGATAVIGLPRDQLQLAMTMVDSLDIAGVTATETTVVSGPPADVARFVDSLSNRGVFARVLEGVDIAFHGRQMEPLCQPLMGSLAGVRPTRLRTRLISTLTGEALEGPELEGSYWAKQLLRPFDLPGALAQVEADLFVEIGPHATLSGALESMELRCLPTMVRNSPATPVMQASLAEVYALGADLDWDALAPEGQLVNLPHYPWQRERYWLDQLGASAARPEHFLRGRVRSLAADAQLFEHLELSQLEPHWLVDHQFHGSVVMPGAAWATLAVAGGGELFGAAAVEVRDLEFHRLLRVPEGGVSVQLAWNPEGPDRASFQAATKDLGRLASGSVHVSPKPEGGERRDLDELRRGCPRAVDPAQLDARLLDQGFAYGPAFAAVEAIHAGEGGALARLSLPSTIGTSEGELHPVMLDAAVRVIATAAAANDDTARAPRGLRRLTIAGPAPRSAWCSVRCRPVADDAVLLADIELLDDVGRVFASVEGFELAPIEASPSLSAVLYGLDWEATEIEAKPETFSWGLVGVSAQLEEALRRRGHTTRAHGAGVEVERVLWVLDPSADAQSACETFLDLAEGLGAARLSIVSSGAQSPSPSESCTPDQAAVWGFARVFANEHPERWSGIIDALEVDVDTLAAALSSAGPDQLMLRGTRAWAPRLRAANLQPSGRPRVLRRDATYLITGGFSGLGAHTARWLVRNGARRLILAARSPLPPRREWRDAEAHPLRDRIDLVLELEALGCAVHPVALDITDADQLEELLTRHEDQGLPPLRGVFHSAGSLRDQLIWRMTKDDLRAVLRPKVDGAAALDRLTHDLDVFVLYSSISSLLGRTGQANYAAANAFLDGLAHRRRAEGLPATVINWGPWRGTGMFAGVHDERAPVQALDPARGVEALAAIFDSQPTQCAVVDADWSRIPPLTLLAGLQENATVERDEDPNKLLELLILEPEDRLRAIEAGLSELVAEVMHTQAARVDVYSSLFELGMDSLMVIELKRRTEAAFGQPLSMNDMFSGTIVQLSSSICVALESSDQVEALLSHIESLPMDEVEALLEGSADG